MPVDQLRAAEAIRELLIAVGEDPTREGLVGTPTRVARFWAEFLDAAPPANITFSHESSDDLVVVSGMPLYSLCEHHLLPIKATVAIGYIPDGHILGLSKFGRIATQFAHRLQVQERLVAQIADEIERVTECPDVAVVARGEHFCMTMRGVRLPARMTTSVMRGRFRDVSSLRAEFLSLSDPPD